jgi:class 3 adenylate cyclase/CHASE2 domain-containing sensor protein
LVPALLVGCVGIILSIAGFGYALEEDPGLPILFAARGERAPPAEVAIVRIDRAAVRDLQGADGSAGRIPDRLRACTARHGGWGDISRIGFQQIPRAIYACLVEELRRRGAGVVVLDVAFAGNAPGTGALAQAIRDHGRVVLLARAERRGPAHLLTMPERRLLQAAAGVAPFTLPSNRYRVLEFWACHGAFDTRGDATSRPLVRETSACRPLRDGHASQLPLRALEVKALPAVGRLEALARLGEARNHAAARGTLDWLAEFGERLAVADPALTRIRNGLTMPERELLLSLSRVLEGPRSYYAGVYGPAGTIPSMSILDLFDEGAARLPLADRTVFIGYQELGTPENYDSLPTVFQREDGIQTSGVEWAAMAYANLRFGDHVRPLPEGARLGLVFALGVTFTFAARIGSLWSGIALLVAGAGLYGALALTLFALWQVWLPFVVPLVMLVPLALLVAEIDRTLGLRNWMLRTMPRWLLTKVEREGRAVAGRPVDCWGTIMFTDIVHSTGLQNRLGPQRYSEVLSRHLSLLARCIQAEGGTIFEYTGDGILALWGYPQALPDQADRAVRAAGAIAAALSGAATLQAGDGESIVRVRIGLHTGLLRIGLLGPEEGSRYGLTGDTVSLGQRVEQLGKRLCNDLPFAAVLMTDETHRCLQAPVPMEDLGLHELRGVETPFRIWRLTGGPGLVGSDLMLEKRG